MTNQMFQRIEVYTTSAIYKLIISNQHVPVSWLPRFELYKVYTTSAIYK
jgi:hypothetical protein